MFLMYVDESGDCGINQSPTRYFILTGIVVHELRWRSSLERLVDFRRRMSSAYGLKLREEIHAVRFINRRPGDLNRILKHKRLSIIRSFIDELSQIDDISIINVVVDKLLKPQTYDVFECAWKALIQRFENTIRYRNFPGPANADERGILFPDRTDDKKLTQLLRKMRRYNPVPNQAHVGSGYRDLALQTVIEDPNFRLSQHSYFIQAADVVAYCLLQQLKPNSYMIKNSGTTIFNLLEPRLCRVASHSDPQGIVRL
jgi:hypothetical protein